MRRCGADRVAKSSTLSPISGTIRYQTTAAIRGRRHVTTRGTRTFYGKVSSGRSTGTTSLLVGLRSLRALVSMNLGATDALSMNQVRSSKNDTQGGFRKLSVIRVNGTCLPKTLKSDKPLPKFVLAQVQ